MLYVVFVYIKLIMFLTLTVTQYITVFYVVQKLSQIEAFQTDYLFIIFIAISKLLLLFLITVHNATTSLVAASKIACLLALQIPECGCKRDMH